jgi:AraC-like DNA-binding protein
MMAFLGRYLFEQSQKSSAMIDSVVEEIVRSEIAAGRTNIEGVSKRLGISTRTLQRKLRDHGTRYADILRAVRISILKDQMSRRPRRPLDQLADLLGFSDATAVSRFIRTTS